MKQWVFHPLTAMLLLLVCLLLVYVNALGAPFIWDDEVMVVGNPLIRSFSHIPSLFTVSAFGEQASATQFYRPFQLMTYAIDTAIWGLNPTGFRITSLILMGIAGGALMRALSGMGLSWKMATFMSIGWAIHPLGIEAVTYVSGRGDVLYVALCMLILNGFIRARSAWPLGWILPVYMVAVLTKENAVPFGLGVLCLCWSNPPRPLGTHHRWIGGSLAAVSVTYAVSRMIMMGGQTPVLSWIAAAPLTDRLMTLPYIMTTYLRLMLVPTPLHMEYHHVSTSPDLYWIAAVGCLLLMAGILYFSSNRQSSAVWMGWSALMLTPVLHIIPLASTVREHWGMLSLMGMMMAVSSLPLWRHRMAPLLLGVMLVGWGAATIERNTDWLDPLTLYAHDVALEPRSFVLHNNLGVARHRAGLTGLSCHSFQDAILSTPPGKGYATAMNNWGVCQENDGRLAEAKHWYEQSIMYGHYELGYLNLARLLLKENQPDLARKVAQQGIDHYPYHTDLLLMLGIAQDLSQGRVAAMATFDRLLRVDPQSDARIRQYLMRRPMP